MTSDHSWYTITYDSKRATVEAEIFNIKSLILDHANSQKQRSKAIMSTPSNMKAAEDAIEETAKARKAWVRALQHIAPTSPKQRKI
jgi:hypothetical protein